MPDGFGNEAAFDLEEKCRLKYSDTDLLTEVQRSSAQYMFRARTLFPDESKHAHYTISCLSAFVLELCSSCLDYFCS